MAATALRRPALATTMVAPYAAALAVASVRTARTLDDRQAQLLVPASFLAMHLGWGLGVWSRALDLVRGKGSQ